MQTEEFKTIPLLGRYFECAALGGLAKINFAGKNFINCNGP
jgi:hypothetical protein